MEALRQGEQLDKTQTVCVIKWKRVDTLSGMSKESTGDDMDMLKVYSVIYSTERFSGHRMGSDSSSNWL
jgi:hypothetical protein